MHVAALIRTVRTIAPTFGRDRARRLARLVRGDHLLASRTVARVLVHEAGVDPRSAEFERFAGLAEVLMEASVIVSEAHTA